MATVTTGVYQIIFPEGQLECTRFEQVDHGIELYDEDDEFVAFVPYANLHAVMDESKTSDSPSEPSVM